MVMHKPSLLALQPGLLMVYTQKDGMEQQPMVYGLGDPLRQIIMEYTLPVVILQETTVVTSMVMWMQPVSTAKAAGNS